MTGKFIMRLLTLASGPAIALLLATILVDVDGGRSEVIEGSIDEGEPLLPSLGPSQAPRPVPRGDALLAAMLDAATASGKPKKYALRQLAGPAGADPVAADLLEWQSLNGGAGGWGDLSRFLSAKPDWPGAGRLRRRAETLMPDSLAPEERLSFFSTARPTTARGGRLYGEALIATGQKELGEAAIIQAWRERSAGASEEKIFLATHGALLKPHHSARFEMLIWRGNFKAAGRLTKNLPEEFAHLRDAVSALMRRRRGVDKLIEKIPEALRGHPMLAYARMIWRDGKRRNDEAEEAIRAASKSGELGDPEAWAEKRVAFVRRAIKDERFADAVDLAEGHGLTNGKDFAELEWLAGWVALIKLKDPERALQHFSSLYNGTVTPISRSRGAYWSGRAARAAGDEEQAELWFRRAAAYPVAFYGQMAIGEIGEETLFFEHADRRVFRAIAGLETIGWSNEEREMARVAARLYRGGDIVRGRSFAKALAEASEDAAAFAQLAAMARRYGDPSGEIVIAKAAYDADIHLWTALYPIPESPNFMGGEVEAALLLAIARQESRFRFKAESHVGARGLMQLMPATARSMAKREGLPYDKELLFNDPTYNLKLGDAFLRDMIRFYDGSYVLAIAAYNGGPGNVNKWIKKYGDPRDPDVDVLEWIENIPFGETRNYVQRVMEGMQVYRIRLAGGRGYIRMEDDLQRGAQK